MGGLILGFAGVIVFGYVISVIATIVVWGMYK